MNRHKLRCAEWDAIQMGDLDETSLFRHLLFLGETGSGKTTSGIKPLCRLAFAADRCFNGKQAAGLVVDPKAELGAYLEELVGAAGADRLLRLKPGGPRPGIVAVRTSAARRDRGHWRGGADDGIFRCLQWAARGTE